MRIDRLLERPVGDFLVREQDVRVDERIKAKEAAKDSDDDLGAARVIQS